MKGPAVSVAIQPYPVLSLHVVRDSSCAERVHRLRSVLLPRPQHHRRKTRMVRRIRKVLSLETESAAMPVTAAVLSGNAAVEEVAGVELHAGLSGVHFQGTSRHRLEDARRQHE